MMLQNNLVRCSKYPKSLERLAKTKEGGDDEKLGTFSMGRSGSSIYLGCCLKNCDNFKQQNTLLI